MDQAQHSPFQASAETTQAYMQIQNNQHTTQESFKLRQKLGEINKNQEQMFKKKVVPVRIAQGNIQMKMDNQTVGKVAQPYRPIGKGHLGQPTVQRHGQYLLPHTDEREIPSALAAASGVKKERKTETVRIVQMKSPSNGSLLLSDLSRICKHERPDRSDQKREQYVDQDSKRRTALQFRSNSVTAAPKDTGNSPQSSNLQMALKSKMDEQPPKNHQNTDNSQIAHAHALMETPDERTRIEHIARMIKNKVKTVDVSRKRCNSLLKQQNLQLETVEVNLAANGPSPFRIPRRSQHESVLTQGQYLSPKHKAHISFDNREEQNGSLTDSQLIETTPSARMQAEKHQQSKCINATSMPGQIANPNFLPVIDTKSKAVRPGHQKLQMAQNLENKINQNKYFLTNSTPTPTTKQHIVAVQSNKKSNQALISQLSAHVTHKINLSTGQRTNHSRLKTSIHKQLVEYSQYKQMQMPSGSPGAHALQDVYHKRQLAGVPKAKEVERQKDEQKQNREDSRDTQVETQQQTLDKLKWQHLKQHELLERARQNSQTLNNPRVLFDNHFGSESEQLLQAIQTYSTYPHKKGLQSNPIDQRIDQLSLNLQMYKSRQDLKISPSLSSLAVKHGPHKFFSPQGEKKNIFSELEKFSPTQQSHLRQEVQEYYSAAQMNALRGGENLPVPSQAAVQSPISAGSPPKMHENDVQPQIVLTQGMLDPESQRSLNNLQTFVDLNFSQSAKSPKLVHEAEIRPQRQDNVPGFQHSRLRPPGEARERSISPSFLSPQSSVRANLFNVQGLRNNGRGFMSPEAQSSPVANNENVHFQPMSLESHGAMKYFHHKHQIDEGEARELNEYRVLFAKLGLNFDTDVPQKIKDQLKADRNSKQILVNLAKKMEQTGDIKSNRPSFRAPPHSQKRGQPDFTLANSLTVVRSASMEKLEKHKKRMQAKTKQLTAQELGDPSVCQAVRPGEPTTIALRNPPLTHHDEHPINKYLRQVNTFCNLSLVRAAAFRMGNNKCPHFDTQKIQSLGKELKIDIPKNLSAQDQQQLFKSKQFIVSAKATILQRLFSLITKSNRIELNFERSQFQFYKAFIGRGNNTPLIVSIMKQHRWWWTIYQSIQHDEEGNAIMPYSAHSGNQQLNMNLYKENFIEHNFLWTQWKKLKHFSSLKSLPKQEAKQNKQEDKCNQSEHSNGADEPVEEEPRATPEKTEHPQPPTKAAAQPTQNVSNSIKVYAKLENNYHLSNKYALFYNMRKYYKALGRDPFEVLPVTFHVRSGTSDPEFVKFLTMQKDIEFKQKAAQREDKDLRAQIGELRKQIESIHEKMDKLKEKEAEKAKETRLIVNEAGNKARLSFLPEVRRKSSDQNVIIDEQLFWQMQQTKKQDQQQYDKYQEEENELQAQEDKIQAKIEEVAPNKNMKNIWIVKPGENTNRGVGITVETNVNEIKDIINSEGGGQRTFILQRYIENPALFKGRKFDIRVFALVTSINGVLKGYNYLDGYLRTSGKEFNLKSFNKFIHLTNDAVQKKAEDYGKYEFGNKVTFQEYQAYLNQTAPDLNIDFNKHLFSQIKRIMADSISACFKILDPQKRCHSFEILGFDFMLDDAFKVYLIEANTNPCLETTCPILQKIIPDIIDSGFRLALDPLFPPPNFTKRMSQQIPLTLWELCYDSECDDARMVEIYDSYEQGTQADRKKETGEEKDEFDEDLIKEEELDEVYD